MLIFDATIKDARGRRVPLVPYDAFLHISGEEGRRKRIQRASLMPFDRPTRRDWLRGIGYGALALPVLLIAALAPAYLAFVVRPSAWTWVFAVIGLGLLPALVTLFLARKLGGRRIMRVYIKAGYCPSCGFDLEGTGDDESGLRVCPECGGAWRMTDRNESASTPAEMEA